MAFAIPVLRLVHILAATVWFGGSLTVAAYVMPTARRVGPDGGRFMQSLDAESGLPMTLTVCSWLATLAGLGLFYLVSGRFDRSWLHSYTGVTISIGMAFGLLAFLHGLAVQSASARRLAALSRSVAASAGTPRPEQVAQLTALREKRARAGAAGAAMLMASAAAMAVARYF